MRSLRTDFGIATTPRCVEPPQDHLRDALAVLLADGAEQLVLEDVVLPFSERSPRLDLHAVLLQELLRLDLLVERMRLDLVDRRRDLVVDDEVHDAIGVKVADADGADAAFAVQLLHRPPRAVHVAVSAGGSDRGRGTSRPSCFIERSNARFVFS